MADQPKNEPARQPRTQSVWALLLAFVIVALLGAGAIALEGPTGQVSGQVKSHVTGKPLAGATVAVTGPVTRHLLTGPDGRFQFYHLPVGTYYISAKQHHFDSQFHENSIKVTEGQSLADLNFSLMRTLPTLEITNQQRVFTPKEHVRILARGTTAPNIEVSLYRLDIEKAMNDDPQLKELHHPDLEKLTRAGLVRSVKQWTQPVPREAQSDDDWFFKPVQVADTPEGSYVVEFSTLPEAAPEDEHPPARLKAAYWFEISHLGLVTKRSSNQLLVYSADLQDKRPIAGTKVSVFAGDRRVGSAVTDNDGVARLPGPAGEDRVWVLGQAGDASAVSAAGWSGDTNAYRIYAYTERPVYRPGQRVNYKAIVRADNEARYSLASGKAGLVTVKDATGGQVDTQSFTLTAASTLDGGFTLPSDAPLGEYNAEVTVGGVFQSFNFKVADYRKPEYKVEISQDKPRYVQGGQAHVHVLSSYYFGAPVPNAKLAMTVYAAPLYGEHDPDEDFFSGFTEEGTDPVWGFGDVIQQAEGTTNAEGKFDLDVALPESPHAADGGWVGDRVFTVAVEAIDASGRPVKGHQSFVVTQGQFKLSVKSSDYLYVGKHPIRLELNAADYDNHPVSTDVKVTVQRLTSEMKTNKDGNDVWETRREVAWSGNSRTDASGGVNVEVPVQPPGDYEILAEAHDAGGRTLQAIGSAWIAAEDEPFAGDSGTHSGSLKLVLDRKVYQPGQTARALIVSPVADVTALVTVEGTRIHQVQVVHFHGTQSLVKFPVTADYEPNAYVAACVVNGKEFIQASHSLNVKPSEKFLQVSVKSDRPRYEPGDRATYTVETKDYNGKPVSADVSLGVVDQAIYAIEPEQTADIRGFFHGPRWNQVRTSYSFSEDYSGGLDKFAPDPRVRAKFEDTAAWYPSLHTDASGRASVTFTLPDNLTTWVATARAATDDTRVGSAISTMVATKNLLVRLETPRFLVMGDHVVISAIAHSYLDAPQQVQLTLALEGLETTAPLTQLAVLAPGDAKRVTWEVAVPKSGSVKARVTARSAQAADAMELSFPVMDFATPQFQAFAGVADAGKPGHATFDVPQDAPAGTSRLSFQLQVTPLPAVLSAVDYLHQFPYGCVEQTMSRFLPDVAIKPRLDAVGAATGDRFNEKQTRLAEGLRRLLGMQHGDGGWGWWEHDETQVEMTSYVLYGLAEARAAGLTPPAAAVKKGVDNLNRAVPRLKKDVFTRNTVRRGAGADSRAFALFALAQWGSIPPGELDRLWTDRKDLSNFGSAQLALTLGKLNDPRRFEALEVLRHTADESEGLAHWNANAEEFAWQDNSTEATAYALRALLAIAPDDPLVDRTVRWLESKNARGYWDSTKDTGAAAIGLADFMQVRHLVASDQLTPSVTLNGAALEMPGASDAAQPATIQVPQGLLKPGENRLEVTVNGPGTLSFSGGVSTMLPADKLSASPGHGLTVSHDYFLLPASTYAKAKGHGSLGEFFDDKLVSGLSKLGGTAKAGDRILVRVSVSSDRPVRYMALEDPLPAGCEILEDQPTEWGYWWDHQEYRDDRAAFFFNRLGKGERTLYYVMRPTTPGRFRVLPSTAWAMYAPDVRARSAGGELVITE